MANLEKRVKVLEASVGDEAGVSVRVSWGDEDVVELAPGETVRVIRWLADDSIEVEELGRDAE